MNWYQELKQEQEVITYKLLICRSLQKKLQIERQLLTGNRDDEKNKDLKNIAIIKGMNALARVMMMIIIYINNNSDHNNNNRWHCHHVAPYEL